jgi:hypothetical protein
MKETFDKEKARNIVLEKHPEYRPGFIGTKPSKQARRGYGKKYRENSKNISKLRARKKVYVGIRNGSIIKLPCEVCGEVKAEAHHADYNQPLEILWLCKKHHCERHS